MVNIYTSNFVRLGHRDYVHASDMIPEMFKAIKSWNLGHVSHLCATFRKIVHNQGIYKLVDSNFNQSDYDAIFEVTCDTGFFTIGLQAHDKDTDVPTIPYDEVTLISQHHIDLEKRTITFHWQAPNPIMKVLIALQKCLLNHLASNTGVGPWMCCKCDLDWTTISSYTNADITVAVQSLLGNYSAKCLIFFEETEVGTLYFTRTKKQ